MSLSDPVADMLTRIRNAVGRKKESVSIPFSNHKLAVLEAFKREGYVSHLETIGEGVKKSIKVVLKYGDEGENAINYLGRESKPSRKIYKGVKDLQIVRAGFGSSFVSTSRGVLSDRECRENAVGGELICTLW